MTDIQRRVCALIAEVVLVPPEKVLPNSNLFELGAQSLEFLDIVFKLEETWGIEITRGELERAARGDLSEEEFAPQGVISDAGLERLRTLFPDSLHRIQPGLRPELILSLFTPQTFVRMVETKTNVTS